jgi:catechol 2,3-dioxygenase-like lactoylglutathione lyase family enzyme
MEKFDHVAFQVNDMDAAVRFYVEKLGFTLASRQVDEAEHEEFAFLMLGEVRLELIQDLAQAPYRPPEIRPPYCPHLAIGTDDLEKTLAGLKDNGVPVLRGPLVIAEQVTWAYFADPDNNILEYVQWYEKR